MRVQPAPDKPAWALTMSLKKGGRLFQITAGRGDRACRVGLRNDGRRKRFARAITTNIFDDQIKRGVQRLRRNAGDMRRQHDVRRFSQRVGNARLVLEYVERGTAYPVALKGFD